jgi:menaquinone-dependent protoporphyrinogen oxidase
MASRFLVAYATREGQTQKVADTIADTGRAMGVDVDVLKIDDVEMPLAGKYDGVALGGSIHMGKFEKELLVFASENWAELEQMHASFFGLCLTAANEEREAAEEIHGYLAHFEQQTLWKPAFTAMFAGALKYRTYGFIKRGMVKQIASDAHLDTDTSRDWEYTDWSGVAAFAEDAIGHAVGKEITPPLRAA